MTRNDYYRAAEIVKTYRKHVSKKETLLITDVFIEFFKNENPRFNADQFREACEIVIKVPS